MWNLRINLIALIGAIGGLLSLSFVWLKEPSTSYDYSYYYIEGWQLLPLQDYYGRWDFYYDWAELGIPILIFLIGTIMAFFSPFGSIPQIIGVSSFLITVDRGAWSLGRSYDFTIQAGPYIALLSSIIVLIGLILPFGIGYPLHFRKISAFGRLLTIGFYSTRKKSKSEESLIWKIKKLIYEDSSDEGQLCSYCGKQIGEGKFCQWCGNKINENN